jgi:hypothetical protein
MRLVAQALDEEQSRVARAEPERLAALHEKSLAPRVAVGALGDRDQPYPLDAKRADDLASRLELPAPAVDYDEIRGIWKSAGLRRLALPLEPSEAARRNL